MDSIEKRGRLPEARFEAIVPRNKVIRVSERYASIFPDLIEGAAANMPLLILPADVKQIEVRKRGSLGAIRAHQRNGHLLRVVSADPAIPTYYSVKGSLYYFGGEPVMWEKGKHYSGGLGGLEDREFAEYDWEWAEKLRALGVDVSEPVAIIELLELPMPQGTQGAGKMVPVSELREELTPLRKDGAPAEKPIVPVDYLRAFTCGTRIEDILYLMNYDGIDGAKEEMHAAIEAIERRHSIRIDSIREYERWVATRIGRNIGIMHANGLAHGFTHYGNFTLAGELVDLDSIMEKGTVSADVYDQKRKEDLEGNAAKNPKWFGAQNQLQKLGEYLRTIFPNESHISPDEIARIFYASYEKHAYQTRYD